MIKFGREDLPKRALNKQNPTTNNTIIIIVKHYFSTLQKKENLFEIYHALTNNTDYIPKLPNKKYISTDN